MSPPDRDEVHRALDEVWGPPQDDMLPFAASVNEERVAQVLDRATDRACLEAKGHVEQWMRFNRAMNAWEEGEYQLWVAVVYSRIDARLRAAIARERGAP
jgi:hypothetical protein